MFSALSGDAIQAEPNSCSRRNYTEARRWMWHKKWALPKIHVRVSWDGIPVGGGYMCAHEPPVHVIVTAGTMRDNAELQDAGLEGENEQILVAGEVTRATR